MESPAALGLTALRTRLAQKTPWIAGPGAANFSGALADARQCMQSAKAAGALTAGPVVVAETTPSAFLAATLAAVERGEPVALASPRWGEREGAQAAAQLRPGLWFGTKMTAWPEAKLETVFDAARWRGAILIPTGGTGGRVRWAIHSWSTLASAARALDVFLGGGPFTHVSTLPVWHVSGLMPAVRALETGGTLWLDEWKTLETGTPPATPPARAIISLVPTQLQRLLSQSAVMAWLRECRAILLGGAAAPAALLDAARSARLPVALAYGMTETAAVVAAQTPADFLAGEPPSVSTLPHARVWIADDTGEPSLPEKPGRVMLEADSLFHGYFPESRTTDSFAAEDDGVLDRQGRLQLLGRRDRVIITGGEKVNPQEVEAALRASGLVEEVLIVGEKHPAWGQQVVALFTGAPRTDQELHAALATQLAPPARPKRWLHVSHLPLDERGKIDAAALAAILQSPNRAV